MTTSETEVRLKKMRTENGSDLDDNLGYRDTIRENVTRVKRLRKALEDWREVLAPMYGVLVWREDWYPLLTSGLISLLFSVVWYLDPPVLTLVAVIGMTATSADYIVPAICQAIFRQEDWTAAKEREYERMCQLIAEMASGAQQSWEMLAGWKKEKPNVYFCAAAFFLCVLAWMGNNLSNLFLSFAIVQFVALYPGMKHRGLIKKYMAESIIFITSKIRTQRPQSDDGKTTKSE